MKTGDSPTWRVSTIAPPPPACIPRVYYGVPPTWVRPVAGFDSGMPNDIREMLGVKY